MERAHLKEKLSAHKSQFANLLLTWSLWGEISCSRCQQLAHAAEQDATAFGLPIHPDVGKLAKLGASGQYVGNVRRDALRCYKPNQGLSTPLWLKLPFWDTKAVDARLPTDMQFPLILPAVLFEDLYLNFRRKIQDMLGAGTRAFWDSMRPDDPRFVNHPMLAKANWKDTMVPLVLHSDGVAFTQKKKIVDGR